MNLLKKLLFWGVLYGSLSGSLACSLDRSEASSEPFNSSLQAKTMRASLTNMAESSMILIYDYQEEGALLEYRAVKNTPISGQPLQDIIQTFLNENHFQNIPTNLQLSTIEKGTPIVLHFSNTSGFQSPQDEELFWNALKMTVYRNSAIENLLIQKS